MKNYEYKKFKPSEQTNELLTKKTAAEDALAELGSYSWSGQDAYKKLLEDYKNRGDFSYDVNADALYNQYKDKYIQQGKMAMADAIGQASAMTGGYGNSYAATVGNQAYQGQMQNLNDVVPELYQMAYDRYNQKGKDMLNAIGLMDAERSADFALWEDKYDRLKADRDYYNTDYNTAWKRDYTDHTNSEAYRYQAGKDEVSNSKASAGNGGASYSDFTLDDWKDYFSALKSKSQAEAEEELKYLDDKGEIPKEIRDEIYAFVEGGYYSGITSV